MKQILAAILLFISLSACNGADNTGTDQLDDNCDFDIHAILNGQNRQEITSEWDCVGPEGFSIIALFEDGTGSTIAGESVLVESSLAWDRLDCRTIFYNGEDPVRGVSLVGVATKIKGSIATKKLEFINHSKGTEQPVTCILKEIDQEEDQ